MKDDLKEESVSKEYFLNWLKPDIEYNYFFQEISSGREIERLAELREKKILENLRMWAKRTKSVKTAV